MNLATLRLERMLCCVPPDENAPECETRSGSAGLRQDCITIESAVFDENASQRPRRNLRRPAKFDDYSVDFARISITAELGSVNCQKVASLALRPRMLC